MRGLLLLAAVSGLLSFAALADDGKVVEKPIASDSLDSFTQQSVHVHEQMKKGGVYDNISTNDKVHVDVRLGEMQKMLEAHPGQPVNDWPAAEKIALFNAQEDVNSTLKHNDNNRLICERRAPVGSNLPLTTCHTYGELSVRRSNDQRMMVDKAHEADQSFQATHRPPGGN